MTCPAWFRSVTSAANVLHLHATLPQVLHRSERGCRRGAAPDQRQPPRAAPRQAVGQRQSEAAETAGDEVAGRGIDLDRPQPALDLELLAVPHRDDKLADVLRLRHVAECVRGPCDWKHAMRQRAKALAVHPLQQVAQH